MIVAHCPRCTEAIRVPSGDLPEGAYASCPLCRETFAASELLERLPPVAEFLGADGLPIQTTVETPVGFAPDPLETDGSSIGASAVAAGGALAAGALATGAAALGLGGQASPDATELDATELDETGVEELDEIQDYMSEDEDVSLDDPPASEPQLDETLDDNDVEQYLGEFSADDDNVDEESTEATVVMDTQESIEASEDEALVRQGLVGQSLAGESVDVESEVEQFLGDDEPDAEPDVLSNEPMEFEPQDESFDPELSDADVLITDGEVETDTADHLAVARPAPMNLRSRPTARRKKSSPLKTLAGVALGPLIALPLAGGILLAIGKAPDLGFWPFDGSGKSASSRFAAAPVGASSAGSPTDRSDTFGQSSSLVSPDSEVGEFIADNAGANATASDDTDPNAETNSDAAPSFAMPSEDAASPAADSRPPMEEPEAVGADTQPSTTPPAPAFADPFAASDPGAPVDPVAPVDSVATADADPIKEAKLADPDLADPRKQAESRDSLDAVFGIPENSVASSNKAAVDAASDSQPATGSEMTTPLAGDDSPFGAGLDLGGPAQTDSPELLAATQSASDAMIDLLAKRAAGEATPRDLAMTYIAVCKVGAIDATSRSTSLEKLLTQVGESTLANEFTGNTVRQWLDHGKRETEGIVMSGTIAGTESQPMLKLSDTESVAISTVDDSPVPAQGRKVVAIGQITGKRAAVLNAVFPIK